jgi:uncharacterized protein
LQQRQFFPLFHPGKSTVTEQIAKGIRFFSHKYPAMQYLAFFQSFSNTYGPLPYLRELYEEALGYPGMLGLVISTRPDCVSTEVLDYLAELSARYYVMIEFGVESHLNRTLEMLNRGHTFEDAEFAIRESAKRKLATTAHMMLGLPGENREEWLSQAEAVSRLPVDNLKLHQLQIHRRTVMARQYAQNPDAFHLFTQDGYTEAVVDYLERLDPRISVERFTSQAPPGLLVAPAWGIKNHAFTAKIDRLLEERDTWQGKFFYHNGATTSLETDNRTTA